MTPADRSQAYAPEEWFVDPIRVLILTPTEADAHEPCPPYDWAEDEPRWYEKRWGHRLCVALILGGVAGFWAVVSFLLDRWF